MALTSGFRLGPYEIQSPLGAGGMGEVYRALDTRLDRTVAIKILPAHLSSDPVRKQRFEREARTISSLNHPHICVVHDIGQQDGIDYLVMECVEGETLAKRLEKGPLPLEQVLKYGAQVAEALHRAHRAGIVHRDLKPGNIMLTPTRAKLLDFGLAKPVGPLVSEATLPTASARPVTQEGTIVGTFQYMSPEQVEGKEVDGRSDIFLLGAVLYEMVTGKRAFEGKSQLSVVSAILEKEPPPISTIKPMTPPALDHAIKKCLAKVPDERWQSASDLASELKWIGESGSSVAAALPIRGQLRKRERLAWGAGALFFALIAASVVFVRLREKPEQSPVGRFDISLQKVNIRAFNFPVISPDGEYVAIAGTGPDGKTQLWVRKLDSLTAEAVPNTDGASNPFWSPDSKSIAFAANGRLQKVALSTGSAQTLCEAPCQLYLGTGDWSTDGIILTGGGDGRLYQLPATGGRPVLIAEPDSSNQEAGLGQPRFLPDGRHFLYFAGAVTPGAGGYIYVGSLDSKEHKLLGNSSRGARYAPPGYLLYVVGSTLVAQRFDIDRLAFAGDPFPIVEVGSTLYGLGAPSSGFSVSQNGVLAYSPRLALDTELVWYDRHGRRLATVGARAPYTNPALSPDGNKLAVGVGETLKRDIWIFDLVQGSGSRLTFDPADDLCPVWSRDGSRILFSSNRKGQRDIYEQAANGLGTTRLVFESTQTKSVNDWSADGRYVVYDTSILPASLWVLPMFGERKPFAFLNANYSAKQAQLSPNGEYIAYSSSETGTNEVYVETFPEHQGKWQISTDGGFQPQWRADGKELFYLTGVKMASVAISTSAREFRAGIPQPLFDTPDLPAMSNYRNSYIVSRDGQRFLFTASPRETTSTFQVLVNWAALLKRK